MGSRDVGSVSWPAVCGNGSDRGIFWDPEKLLNSTEPDLAVCFQQTVLVWVPFGIFWICLPFYSAYLCSRCHHYMPGNKTKLNIIKLVLTVLLCGVSLADFIKTCVESSVEYQPSLAAYLDPGIRSLSFLVAVVYIHWQFSVGVHTSGVFFCLWFLLTVVGIIPFRTKILDAEYNGEIEDVFRFVTFYIYYVLVVTMWILEAFFADLRILPPKRPTDERTPLLEQDNSQTQNTKEYPPCPEVSATFLSNITYWWITKLLFRGYRKPIVFGDMTDILNRDRSKTVFADFNKAWRKQVETKDDPSLLQALIYTCRWEIFMAATFRFLGCLLEFTNPLLLQAVIAWVSGKDPFVWKGYVLALALLGANVLNAIIYHIFFKYSYITAMRIRTAIITSVYRKALRLSSATRRHTTVGEIVNLMSVDAQKLHDVAFDVHEVWAGPVMLVIAMYLLWDVIGPSCLAGLGFLLCLAPLNGAVFARKFAQIQGVQMKHKDNRIKLTNELLNGIKVLKMYAWEPSFAGSIEDVRYSELKCVRSQALLSAGVGISWFCAPFMVPLAVFAVYVLSSPDNYLDPEKAFVTINLIGILNWAVAFLPIFIAFAAQAYISTKRIIGMLLQEEIDPDAIDHEQTKKNAIEMRHGTYTWDPEGDNGPVLKDITVDIPDGSLVGVVGTVGAGKSSLIAALLGELQSLHGSINIKGSLAYVPQQAWIQNATAKDNILFGKALQADKYKRIIEACALTTDFEILPAGDMTEIGEKGINLSGGQKQRVSLARAVYQSEDIYLMDDPLSAVDAHVGKHIFDNVIGPDGLLQNKTRVLVTHGLVHLPRCDVIIVMKDGEVSECGTYQELLIRDGAFAEYLRQYLNEVTDAEELAVDPDLRNAVQELERQLSTLSEGTPSSRCDSGAEEGTTLRKRKLSARRVLSRAVSTVEEEEKGKDEQKDILVQEEEAAIGAIKWAVISDYVKAGTLKALVGVILFSILFVGAEVATNIWLSAWSDDPILNGTEGRAQTNLRLGVYGGLGALQVLGVFGLSLAIFLGGVEASKKLHARLLDRIIRAPMAFFDTTPIGRIINRFSTDMDKLDNNIPMFTRWWLYNGAAVIATIVVISYSTPIFLVVVVPLSLLYYMIQRVYITSVRQMKRIDSIRKTPIYVNFDETLVGVACVRAFNRQNQFIDRNDKFVDDNTRAWYPILIAQRWLGVFLDTMGAFVVFFAALFAVLTRDTITGGLVGLSVSFAMQTTWAINMMVRGATDLETHVVSAERIKEYSEIATEAEWEIEGEEPEEGWPLDGVIEFKDYSTRYRPGLDLVLKDLSFRVGGGEKVGVVGRTGAGKSSMTLSLFRIIESAGGRIEVDGVDISRMGLHDLRSRLTIIPQDPVLFAGTMRRNLDPFEVYTDEEIWTVLEHAHLKTFVTGLTTGLEYEVGEGGQALSVGQRQLLCLARALLRRSQILVLDEATAAVDLETDDLIQTTIREAFKDCTVMTIAHRLNTVMDYDRVMVLDQGQIKEFDSPSRLLEDENTIFYGMAKDASIV